MNNQELTNEEQQALIEHIQTDLDVLRNVTLKFCDECEREDVERDIQVQEIALESLTADPVKVPVSSTDWVFIRFTDVSKNQRMKCKIEWTDGYNSVICDEEGAPLLLSNNAFEVLRLNAIDNTAQQYEALDKEAGNDQAGAV